MPPTNVARHQSGIKSVGGGDKVLCWLTEMELSCDAFGTTCTV